ncbi:carbon storage regulator [Clostridiales bacterium COT073_COT-073]|nr:carbon storage regulator [Clostridiales bacterium COT073_COT-073]
MLALSRRIGESIIIDNEIVVTVIGVSGEQVKLGIQAPSHIKIYREEIQAQIREENKAALKANDKSAEALKKLMKK